MDYWNLLTGIFFVATMIANYKLQKFWLKGREDERVYPKVVTRGGIIRYYILMIIFAIMAIISFFRSVNL